MLKGIDVLAARLSKDRIDRLSAGLEGSLEGAFVIRGELPAVGL